MEYDNNLANINHLMDDVEKRCHQLKMKISKYRQKYESFMILVSRLNNEEEDKDTRISYLKWHLDTYEFCKDFNYLMENLPVDKGFVISRKILTEIHHEALSHVEKAKEEYAYLKESKSEDE